jgi:hypothetical protein
MTKDQHPPGNARNRREVRALRDIFAIVSRLTEEFDFE